ncbi:MAG: phosphoribosylglycinamide formyltransferase [Planctomycetota bacterium]|nr:phosphoribosylglycinamide formyltransferase [Planctomycetota bacterium]
MSAGDTTENCPPEEKLPIAVLISGGGTTLKNLLSFHSRGELDVDFRLVVSSRVGAHGLAFANEAAITKVVHRKRDFASAEEHSQAVFAAIREQGVELVVMGGYLEHLLIPDDFENRVVNIHPSLIPAFSGQGFYGLRVHQAAVDYGAKISGCTVHFVDNQYDHGPIIAQRSCEVLSSDSAEDLQKRVFELECQLLPEVVQAIACGRVQVTDRRVDYL